MFFYRMDLEYWSLPRILAFCVETAKVDRALLSVRLEKSKGQWHPRDNKSEHFIRQTWPRSILETFIAIDTPGASSPECPAKVFVLELDKFALLALEKMPKLSDWHNMNGLPEDLCLFAEGAAAPSFTSITHEGDGFMVSKTSLDLDHAEFFSSDSKDMGILGNYYYCERLGKQ
jgi:hypothetical protein